MIRVGMFVDTYFPMVEAEKTLQPSSEHTQLAQEETSVIETQQTVTSLADPPQLATITF